MARVAVGALIEPAVASRGVVARVELDASASHDPLGRRLTYRWSVVSQGPWGAALAEAGRGMSPRSYLDLTGPGEYEAALFVEAEDGRASDAAFVRLRLSRRDEQPPSSYPFSKDAGAADRLELEGERFALTASAPAALAPGDLVQLYIAQKPLAPEPAALDDLLTTTLKSVTITAGTTSGTVMDLNRVRADGQFFFPQETLRRYTLQLSASAARQIILRESGTVFIHPDVVGSAQNVVAILQNTAPNDVGVPSRTEGGCVLGRPSVSAGAAMFLALLAPLTRLLIQRRG